MKNTSPPAIEQFRRLRIAYCNDQLFPSHETDTEQIMAMVDALAGVGDDVRMVLPSTWRGEGPTLAQLTQAYAVRPNFRLVTRPGPFPTHRGVEKTAHPVMSLATGLMKDADIVYTRNLPTAAVFLAFGTLPVFYETFRPWPRQMPMLRPFLRWMVRHDRFLGAAFHSAFAARSFAEVGLRPEQSLVAHNGYHPRRMQPELSRQDARRLLNLPSDGRVVTYTGHVSLKKGLGLMLDMAEQMPEVRFIIVGSRERGEVERRAETLSNVQVVPWRSFKDTVPYLYAADVLFIPPTLGPLEKVGDTVLPIKTFLYLAAGRTIFGPSSPDLMEVLEDGRNAVLTPPDHFPAALARLRDVLTDEALLTRIGVAAKADAQNRTWDARARKIHDFIVQRLQSRHIAH